MTTTLTTPPPGTTSTKGPLVTPEAHTVTLRQTVANSLTMAYRGILKIKHNPEQLFDVTLQPNIGDAHIWMHCRPIAIDRTDPDRHRKTVVEGAIDPSTPTENGRTASANAPDRDAQFRGEFGPSPVSGDSDRIR